MVRLSVLLLVCLLGAALIPQSATASPWSLEYRAWRGFYGGGTFDLRYQPAHTPFGLRLWGAMGEDEVPCQQLGCWQNVFGGVDLTYAFRPQTILYLGVQSLWRSTEDVKPPVGDWVHRHYEMSHRGPRLGIMGTAKFTLRLEGIYDIALMPGDRFEDSDGTVRRGIGAMYQVGLRYALSASSYLELGVWNWGFDMDSSGGRGGFSDHIWLGPYLSFGVRF